MLSVVLNYISKNRNMYFTIKRNRIRDVCFKEVLDFETRFILRMFTVLN